VVLKHKTTLPFTFPKPHVLFPLLRSCEMTHPSPMPVMTFCNMLYFYDKLLASCQIQRVRATVYRLFSYPPYVDAFSNRNITMLRSVFTSDPLIMNLKVNCVTFS